MFKDKKLNSLFFREQSIFSKRRHESIERIFLKKILNRMKSLDKNGRIKLLRKYNSQKIYNIISYKKRRKEKYFVTGVCKICEVNNASCGHHIIFVKNGGSNGKNNRLPICNNCHKKIHPWMKKCIAMQKPQTMSTNRHSQ